MKTIEDIEIKGKKVIIRVDFNVPLKDGEIKDNTRIVESLPTIKHAIKEGAQVILMSHLGRVKTEEDLSKSLEPVAKELSKLLKQEVTFINETRGKKLEKAVSNLSNGEVVLMENTRFEDLEGKKESKNDEALGAYWSSLGEVFINDAFGTAHREHASNVGIASNLESGIGFLIEKELTNLKKLQEPDRPFTIILGGAKINDKISLIESLVEKADYILVGGGMAFTFLKALGFEIGKSILDEESINFCKKILAENKSKIILPIDVITEDKTVFVNEMGKEDIGYDIGPNTVKLFSQYLKNSKTVFWNGPMGLFENGYSVGTTGLCETLKNLDAFIVCGGGDTANAVKIFKFEKIFSHISTGGGASLEYLEGKILPGIEVIDENLCKSENEHGCR